MLRAFPDLFLQLYRKFSGHIAVFAHMPCAIRRLALETHWQVPFVVFWLLQLANLTVLYQCSADTHTTLVIHYD